MAEDPEREKFLAQARRRMNLVKDRDILDTALEAMKQEYALWKSKERYYLEHLPPKITARHPDAVHEMARMRSEMYDRAEGVAYSAEREQGMREARRGPDLDTAFRRAARLKKKERGLEKDGGRER